MTEEYLTQAQYAKRCGVTQQAISKKIRTGDIESTSKGIPPEHPKNLAYQATVNPRAKGIPQTAGDQTADELEFNPLQNNYEITRLNKAKADKEVLAYATKLGAVVDNETLNQKFNIFMDFIVSHLIAMPDDIADMLWSKANGSDNPEMSIRMDLKDRVATIIENAQAASEKVVPVVDKRKYVITDIDSKKSKKIA